MIRRRTIAAAVTGALLLFAGSATAQAVWNFELVAGLNFSELTGDDTDASLVFSDPDLGTGQVTGDIGGMKLGFTVGALVTVDINENFSVQSGLLWARKGSDGEITLQGDIPGLGVVDLTADVTVTLDYVEIPILGVLSFPAGQTMRFRAMAGPVLAFNSNAELTLELSGFEETQDIGDEIKSVDVGGLIGAGLVFPVGTLNFHLDARYFRGFTSIDDSSDDLDMKNAGFSVVAALGIPLTR